jgi:protein-tyrosine-phosphatase
MFKVVFICTGNRARSAIAEAYLRRATDGLPVVVESAGTLDLEPGPALPEAIEAARGYGLDLSKHRSRCLIGLDFSDADLVLGFEQQHIATAVVDGGANGTKAFLMAELIRLLKEAQIPHSDDVEERARQAVKAASDARLRASRFVPGEELADPIGKGEKAFEETARAVTAACTDLCLALFGAGPGTGRVS